MVSEVLNENTQKVLEALIQEQFENAVIPSISQVASKTMTEHFATTLNAQVSHSVQKEIRGALPSAASHAMKDTDFIKAIADRVGAEVTVSVQREVMTSLASRLSANFTHMATQAAQRVAGEMQQHHRAEIERIEAQRAADTKKVDQLMSLVSHLSDTVSTMAAAQSQFQGEFLKFQQQAMRQTAGSEHHAPPAMYGQMPQNQPYGQNLAQMQSPDRSSQLSLTHPNHYAPSVSNASNASKAVSDYDVDLEHRIGPIDASIKSGKVEEAMIRWMQSGREQDVFEKYLYKYNPQILRGLPQLVLLSVAATITAELEGSLTREKVTWLETVIHLLHATLGQMVG
jgi:hypothetical protein